ncbi:MAG: hypothetical protein O3A00_15160 [Planctomycetota bacterium]|nr:hypothetical protein [Planctomycetota bacterium]
MNGFSNQSEFLSAYLDGELTADESTAIQQLLDSSDSMREELGELRDVSCSVRSLPAETAPSEFSSAVMSRIERETLLPKRIPIPAPQARRNWAVTVGTIVATIAVMAVVVREPQVTDGTDAKAHESQNLPLASNDVLREPAAIESPSELRDTDGHATSGIKIPADVKVGDIIRQVRDFGGPVAIVELTVVDVAESIDRLEVLLMDGAGETNAIETPAPERRGVKKIDPVEDGLFALYVERDSVALTAALSKFFGDESVRILEADAAESDHVEVAAIGEQQAEAVAKLAMVLKGLEQTPDSGNSKLPASEPTTSAAGSFGGPIALLERPLRVLARKRVDVAPTDNGANSDALHATIDETKRKQRRSDPNDPLVAEHKSAPLRVLFVFQNP